MKKFDFLTEPLSSLIFALSLLLGRFPVWVLLIMVLAGKGYITWQALLCLIPAMLIAKGYLFAYSHDISFARGAFRSIYIYLLRPVFTLIAIEMLYFGITYLVLAGNKTDWGIFFAMFACFILSYAAGILAKPKKLYTTETLVPRTLLLRAVVVLLWLYFLMISDSDTSAALAVSMIYSLEFLSTYSIREHKLVI